MNAVPASRFMFVKKCHKERKSVGIKTITAASPSKYSDPMTSRPVPRRGVLYIRYRVGPKVDFPHDLSPSTRK